ncbi:hypothetical protein CK203_044555 [Vitis vinifera]|uniref:Uncharacterized protein n=1 Tax=Vitis vinifera TaxID=29760 RepID=A0A438HAZ2_VITVI|nr:hypothetical protein CK203_044555 [Vitis vinifera]
MNKASASHPHRSQRASEEEQEKRAGNFQEKRAVRSHAMEKSPVTEVQGLERKPSEDINASADAFIKRFRQHLLIQRLESIENYEQMLEEGSEISLLHSITVCVSSLLNCYVNLL